MGIDFILKIAGIGILVSLCAQVLSKSGREEQATFVGIGGIIVVLTLLIGGISELIELIYEVFSL